MIDYKKLEMAHSLASKCPTPLTIQHTWSKEQPYYRLFIDPEDQNFYDFENEDSLLSKINQLLLEQKLRELKSEECKWEPGDTVWLLDGSGQSTSFLINKVHTDQQGNTWFYESDDGWKILAGTEIFYRTEIALVQSQLEYWNEQLKNI